MPTTSVPADDSMYRVMFIVYFRGVKLVSICIVLGPGISVFVVVA